jgi:gamma-glutamyltranspeptidase/glutathione hydrolase
MRTVIIVAALVLLSPDRPDPGVPSKDGLVVCVSAPACDAGASVLASGGSAVDAAVATAFALAVTHPSAGNIGGGGFMIVRAPSGEIAAFDYREKAPLRSRRAMYLRSDGSIDRSLATTGYLAPGVPGTVRGLELAHQRFGKLRWREIVMPAVTLAERGFTVSEDLARGLNRELERHAARFPEFAAAYGKSGGGKWAAGDHLVLRELAKTLRAIADGGADVFYKGWIADRIAEDMKSNGGLISKEDLAAYRAKERHPIRGTYKDYEIVSMPPPSSGGTVLIEMLNILEQFDLKSKGLLTAPALHLEIEAMRRAFLDRARYLGDPDFVDMPLPRLTSKEYGRTLAASIRQERASSSIELGQDIISKSQPPEADETTHFSVIDRNGMAVANTTTLEGGYGSHVVVKGAGFLLNNEMSDFNKKPGETNTTGDIGTPANLIDPGKRMLSSMTPTMVLKDGRPVLITGSPGDRTIINTVLTVVLGVVEYDLDGRRAVDTPRITHSWLPDRALVEPGVAEDVRATLRSMGHDVQVREAQGDAHTIWIARDGSVYGVNDKRSPDSKPSVPQHLTAPSGGR